MPVAGAMHLTVLVGAGTVMVTVVVATTWLFLSRAFSVRVAVPGSTGVSSRVPLWGATVTRKTSVLLEVAVTLSKAPVGDRV